MNASLIFTLVLSVFFCIHQLWSVISDCLAAKCSNVYQLVANFIYPLFGAGRVEYGGSFRAVSLKTAL